MMLKGDLLRTLLGKNPTKQGLAQFFVYLVERSKRIYQEKTNIMSMVSSYGWKEISDQKDVFYRSLFLIVTYLEKNKLFEEY